MMVMGIKTMKKLLTTIILTLLLATGAQANQEGSIDKEVLTIKSEIKCRPSIDPDVKVEFVIIHKILLVDDRYGNGKVILDLEIVDYKGNHTFKTCEKNIKSGHDYFYEVVTEETKVKGKIKQ